MVNITRRGLLRTVGIGVAGAAIVVGRPEPPTVTQEALTSSVGDRRFSLGGFNVVWKSEGTNPTLLVKHNGRVLWRTRPGENFLEAADATFETRHRVPHEVMEEVETARARQRVKAVKRSPGGNEVSIAGTLTNGSDRVPYTTTVTPTEEGHLRMRVECETDRLGLRYAADPNERFHGFGEQTRHLDLSGQQVPIVTQEPGIGRDHVVVETLVELTVKGASGSTVSSYAPMPYYLSSAGYSLFLENTDYSVFDLRSDNESSVRCFTNDLVWRLVPGGSALDRIESYTEYTGRMPALPDWIHDGAIVGLQGGTDRVRDVWSELRKRNTPIAGFWLQDWVGQRQTSFGEQLWWNWELDEQQYPNWDTLVTDLNAAGVDLLGYVNPYLVDVSEKSDVDWNLFAEAREAGYLVTRDGETYMLPITDFSAGIVDLSDEEARGWLRKIIRTAMFDNGFRGWMADFGEGLPFDCELAAADSRSYHNRYPVEWAALNREVIEAAGREDAVFFTRSGFTRSPAHSPLFWTGDQLVSWGDRDGFETSIRALQTSGLSGISLNHFDAGGYTSIVRGGVDFSRDRELLRRWLEASAFTAVFRTHEGNQPDENAQIYTDSGTYDGFARCAKTYTALAPYRKSLYREASMRGWPVVRPLFVHYPDDATARKRPDEFLLGRDVLVAPVLSEGVRNRSVYLPDDDWTALWTGNDYGGGTHTVHAPLGEPPVFLRRKSGIGDDLRDRLREYGVIK